MQRNASENTNVWERAMLLFPLSHEGCAFTGKKTYINSGGDDFLHF